MLSVVIWNVEKRSACSAHGRVLRERIMACTPHIVCITEGPLDFLALPHRIQSEGDYGYPAPADLRKVLLWSRAPWEGADLSGDPAMPGGRYVAGRTATPLGPIRVVGVCIPWAMAHVSSGRRDRGPWEDHLAYLGGLRRVLHGNPAAAPSLVVGDWNQMIPRIRAPDDVFAALTGAFPPDMEVATQGELSPLGRRAVDHAAHTPGLVPVSVRALSNIGEDGMPLTDHFGVHITFAPRTE